MTEQNPKPQIYTNATDKTVLRIMPKLATEIGLNESILLLQISYWISCYNNYQDGKWWVYKSTRDMVKEAFPFWSVATANRAINSLIDKELIYHTDEYNKLSYDKTRWFALNVSNLAKLKSVVIVLESSDKVTLYQNDTPMYQNETQSNQNDTRSAQNDTTIQETSTETSTESKDINNAPETDNDNSEDEKPVEDDSQDNTPEVSKDTNKLARGLIAVYLKTTKTVNSSAYRFWMKEAQELAERDITPAHVAEWVKDITSQEWWSSGMPTWAMMCQKIVSWRDEYEAKKNKPTIDRRLQARKLPVNIDMLTGDQSA